MQKVEEGVSTYQNSDEDIVMISAPTDTSDNQPSGDEVLSPGLTNNQPSGDEVLSPGLANTHDLITVQMLSTEQSRSTSTGMDEAVLPISPSTAEDEVMISPPADTSDKYPSIIVQLNDKSGNKVLSSIVTGTHDPMTVPVLSTEQSISTSTAMEEDVLPTSSSTAEDEVMISPPTDTSDKYPSIIVQLNDKSGNKVLSSIVTDTHDPMTIPVLSTEQSISTSTGVEEAVLPISPSTAEDEVMISPPTDTSDKYLSIIVQLNDKPGNKVLSPIVTDTHDQVAVSVFPTEQSVSNNTSSRNNGSNNFLS